MGLYNKYGIYGIKNKINNKIYVGKTCKSFGDRFDCHKGCLRGGYHENKHLQNAWNKYGECNFDFIILHDCTGYAEDYVDALEIEEIAKYKSLGLAYNIHDGGSGGLYLGKHLSDETKRKIGEKNRINMTGRKFSNETKAKMSASQKKRYDSWTEDERAEWGRFISDKLKGTKKPTLSQTMKDNKRGSKYSVEQVKEIRRLYEQEKLTISQISKIMKIPRGTVYLIATYRRWKYVPENYT